MASHEPARTTARRIRSTTLAAVVLFSATFIGVVGWQADGCPPMYADAARDPRIQR